MAVSAKERLILQAASVARRAPDEWSDFLKALTALSDTTTHQFLSSPAGDLQRHQGRAQMLVDLLADLGDCVRAADQIREKRRQ